MKGNACFLAILVLTGVFVSCKLKNAEIEEDRITDIDGNEYYTVKIGNQIWMAENLRTLHYRNGDRIPNVSGDTEWMNRTTGGTCIYGSTTLNVINYGRLYNWHAVNDSRNIAPEGWHVPTNDEWKTLIDYLGGTSIVGGKLKAAGTYYWQSPNTGASNESGFFAQPGGCRNFDGPYSGMGQYAWFFTASEGEGGIGAFSWEMRHDSGEAYNSELNKLQGLSVRCIKDIEGP